MIFVTVGTTDGDFKRLFIAIDQLVVEGILTGVTAQIGHSTYEPSHCHFKRHFTHDEMSAHIRGAEFVISHGGAATLGECLEKGKKVIAAPRLASCNEAPDDHQLKFVSDLAAKNCVLMVTDMLQLKDRVGEVGRWKAAVAARCERNMVVEIIDRFIEGLMPNATKD
jgi:UDP-N-acetylglucosamine transferase subunit ALG13